eukprot:scaffold7468_cov444-Prasinococcus_capsulatus_cf.AAC.3
MQDLDSSKKAVKYLLIQILPRVFHVYGSLIADRALEARVSRHVLEAFFVDRVTATQHRYRPDGVEEILETDRTVRHHAAFNACMVPPHTVQPIQDACLRPYPGRGPLARETTVGISAIGHAMSHLIDTQQPHCLQ